tara:strand:+ start:69 stop:278 length:210 start_codon:yes stop_codon:yes gene_type:complete
MWFWERKLTISSLRMMLENQSHQQDIFLKKALSLANLINLELKELVQSAQLGSITRPSLKTQLITLEIL